MSFPSDLKARVQSFQWLRGLRAAVVMGSIMVVCHLLGLAPAAAALGGFDALLVDNGGPYRTRLITMATTLLGGSAAMIIGCMLPSSLAIVLPATMLVCFLVIFGRAISQPWSSASLLILVLYFAGLGGVNHTWHAAHFAAQMVLLGGAWAALLSLMFWPVDPFRPARLAVAECYNSLANLTAAMSTRGASSDWRRQQRILIEKAHTALSATVARAPSRTVRARNLTVLLETNDLLQARNTRLTEMADLGASSPDSAAILTRLQAFEQWLAAAERAVYEALAHRTADSAAAFAHDGSQRIQFITRRRAELTRAQSSISSPLIQHILTEERDALFEIEVAFDAVYAIWTGSGARRISAPTDTAARTTGWDLSWIDAAQANWTFSSAAMRHALRLGIVGAADVVVMRLIHVNHGYWLPMTSIILMQPYSAGTARKSVQRVTGTVAGGILAAILSAALPGPLSMIAVITALTSLTLATYAIDYAIYSFFLTPAFVLLSLPHPHDWRYAGIRIGTTLAGATIAILAMRLLWPERAEEELGRLLRRGVAAEASYIHATMLFWKASNRRTAEHEILAPARRACGLASNDAEEAVDRVMQEPAFVPQQPGHATLRSEALTFATYLRRLTQSITTLAAVGRNSPNIDTRLEAVATRLASLGNDSLANAAQATVVPRTPEPDPILEEQLQRIERQTGVLERAAANLIPTSPV
jgi:uncharacterized membrane protein YccC